MEVRLEALLPFSDGNKTPDGGMTASHGQARIVSGLSRTETRKLTGKNQGLRCHSWRINCTILA